MSTPAATSTPNPTLVPTRGPAPYDLTLASPIGPLGLRLVPGGLGEIDFLAAAPDRPLPPLSAWASSGPDAELVAEAARQIERYFLDPRAGFRLPLVLGGTPFQRRVWQALQTIAPGRTLTYGELAERLGSSARAVGGACRANPLPIVVPCHRVVARGGLGGFAGASSGRKTDIKQWLLEHERGG